MWEHKSISVRDLGKLMFLDSGTLTPMLKKMENAGWIKRQRSENDERVVIISITEKGEELHDKAAEVPIKMAQCVTLEGDEAVQLYTLLNKFMKTF